MCRHTLNVMSANVRTISSEPVTVERIGGGVWILRVLESLELRAVPALREAFGEAIECDASDVVVDLAMADSVSTDGAAALADMADLMHGRDGALWIAARRLEGDGYTLRPVEGRLPDGLVGVHPALDHALSGLSTRVRSVRTGSAILADRFREEAPADASDVAGVPA